MIGPWIVAATALLGQSADSQTTPAAPVPPPSSLDVSLLAGAWLPRVGGESSLGVGGSVIAVDTQLDLSDTEPTLNLELTFRKNQVWDLTFTGFSFSTLGSGNFVGTATFGSLTLNNGDPYVSTFEIKSASAELAYAFYRPYAEGSAYAEGIENRTWDDQYIADLRFAARFGMRYLDVDQSISSLGTTASGGGEWLAVYVGLDVELDYRPEHEIPFLRLVQLQAGLAVGPALGGDGGFMWQVRGGLAIQFIEQAGIFVGYRLVEMNVEKDTYSFDGGLQGLYLAGSIRF